MIYSNPLPHVLILTAIVVGIATTSLGLALIIRIREEYHTIEEHEIAKREIEIFIAEYNDNQAVSGDKS
jgi:multicomponent Na+:H+ antiporter subunit C